VPQEGEVGKGVICGYGAGFCPFRPKVAKEKLKMPCEHSWGRHGCGKLTSIVGDEVGEVWQEGKFGKDLVLVGRRGFVVCRPNDKKQEEEELEGCGAGCQGGNVVRNMVWNNYPARRVRE